MYSGQKYLVQHPDSRRANHTPNRPRAGAERACEAITRSCQVGFPIRTSRDQRVLSPPPGLSQSATSFIASCCQGIHQTPFSRLIRSGRRRALLQPALLLAPVRKSRRGATGPKGQSTAFLGQCLQTWKDCLECPTASGCLRTQIPRHRTPEPDRPPLGPNLKTSRVLLSSRC